ncbi:SHOCT domain-containing protein [Mycobacterium paraffinicum]|uniref:SHOCT domain-containing protein n=1 Tax=Mycobacterium paraffinicum TaxID=53378 RepID=A0ABP8RKX1_9MYCO|nr:SHOCT domain-containing protein [Mycobacterium paraffinicum]
MFGRRDLSKVGIRAFAEVLSAEQSAIAVTVGNPNLVGNTEVRWKLLLRVTPDAEPPFEASLTTLLPQLSPPRPGMRLPVLYDPKDHGRVQMDRQPAATADVAIDAVTSARPDLAGAQVIGMPMADVIRQAIADPAAFREEMMRRGAEMQQQALGAMQAAQTQQGADPVERLERLAALKDRGLLTDEEFEQQKRKILGD